MSRIKNQPDAGNRISVYG